MVTWGAVAGVAAIFTLVPTLYAVLKLTGRRPCWLPGRRGQYEFDRDVPGTEAGMAARPALA